MARKYSILSYSFSGAFVFYIELECGCPECIHLIVLLVSFQTLHFDDKTLTSKKEVSSVSIWVYHAVHIVDFLSHVN